MKKIALIMLVFLLTITSAFAAFDASSVAFGDDNQERAEDVAASITVTNREASRSIINITVSFNGAAKYEFDEVSVTGLSIAQDQSETLSLSAFVPLDLDAVDSEGKKIAVDIGTADVTVVYDDLTSETNVVAVSMEAENLLEFDRDSKIIFDDGNDDRLDDGETYDEIKRDDDIRFEVVIENQFDNDGDCDDPDDYGDCDIEDIELTFEPDDADWDDEDIDFNDLSAEDTDTESFTIIVPDDIDEDDYDFEMWVVGEDENGALHGEYMEFTLEVEVEDDEVTITDLYTTPSRLACGVRHFTLYVEIENTGTDDQNRAAIEIDSPRLDLQDSVYNIEIDEGDTETESFGITLDEDIEPGTYYITVETFYNNNEESDIGSVEIVVEDCVADDDDDDIDWGDDDDDNMDDDDDSQTDVNIIEVPPSTGVIVGGDKEPDFFESRAYTLLLGALFLIALLMFFILIVVILKK